MKKSILLLSFFALISISNAQITLEQTYPASATLTDLALSGYKYFLMDVTNNQCRIYNTDHSIWKTIALSVPSGQYLYNLKYVSETLFNTDSKVELAYTYYSYDTTKLYYTYSTRVIDENGIELLTIPGCSYVDVKNAGAIGSKLLAYVYDYSIIPYTLNTKIYSVPGSMPPGGIATEGEGNLLQPFPNPSSSVVTIPYKLPEGSNNAQIILIIGSGQILKSYQIDRAFNELIVPTSDLPKGVILYQLKSDQGIISTGKLIHN